MNLQLASQKLADLVVRPAVEGLYSVLGLCFLSLHHLDHL